jgi:hypothetical protein
MGGVKRIMLVVAGLFAALGAAPASATIRDICAAEAARILPDPEGVRRFLRASSPVRDMSNASRLKVVLTDDESWGPSIDETGLLSIPRRFPDAQCKAVVISFLLMQRAGNLDPAVIAPDFRTCLADRSEYDCIDELMRRYGGAFERALAALPAEPYRLISEVYASEALDFTFLHEFANLALGHLGRVASPQREFDADNYALRALSVIVGRPESASLAMLLFALADVADPGSPTTGTHDSYVCRLDSSQNLMKMMADVPTLLLAIQGGPSIGPTDPGGIAEARHSRLRELAEQGFPEELDAIYEGNCPSRRIPQFDAVRADLMQLVRFQVDRLGRLPALTDNKRISELMQALIDLEMTTDDGRAVRMNLFVEYLEYYSVTNGVTRGTIRDVPSIADPAMTAGDSARYAIEMALRDLYYPIGGRQTAASLDSIEARLSDASELRGYHPQLRAGLIRVRLAKGNCPRVRNDLGTFFGASHAREFPPALRADLVREINAAGCGPLT